MLRVPEFANGVYGPLEAVDNCTFNLYRLNKVEHAKPDGGNLHETVGRDAPLDSLAGAVI